MSRRRTSVAAGAVVGLGAVGLFDKLDQELGPGKKSERQKGRFTRRDYGKGAAVGGAIGLVVGGRRR
jgi:hypothetical protein